MGLMVLVWSADRFVEGAAFTARYLGISALVIGMVIVGFGTSAPELIVSGFSSYSGNSGIALGNAYGSNITNIGLILGVTAMIKPITVHSRMVRREIPVLLGATAIAVLQLLDLHVSRTDAVILGFVFLGGMIWTFQKSSNTGMDSLSEELEQELDAAPKSLRTSIISLIVGLMLLIGSSRLLVWGAVEIAQGFGVSDLIIGLTIVAVGTSLPEFASSLAAVRKGEHDIALGNVVGSNLFNTLAVVGLAGLIRPMQAGAEVLYRDLVVMILFTTALFLMAFGVRGKQGRINRLEGGFLFASYLVYVGFLIWQIAEG